MSRVFSIRTVLRQTPNRLVRQLLERLGHTDLEVPWDELGERDVEPVVEQLNTLTVPEFDAVEGALHAVFDLACHTGVGAIREMRACETAGEPGGELPDAGLYEQAVWAWLHWPTAVEQALVVHHVDHLSWWRRRNDLPVRPPDASPEALARLGREISALLRDAEGRGRNCTVEAFARHGTVYYFAFPDDFVVNATAHDEDGRLAPRTFRRTFTMVFALDPTEGALELHARVAAPVKFELERVFARVVFGAELGPWRPDPAYEPNALRDRGFRTETDPRDNVSVDVRQLRLSFVNSARQVLLRGDPERPGDVFRMIDEVLDAGAVPPGAVNVTLITFCFEFRAVGRRRPGSVTFDVAYPNSCSLRNQRPERVAVIEKYLTRWGIYVARPAGADLGAA